jgi:hypothetical protein
VTAPTLFDANPIGQVRATDPETSHHAARLPRKGLALAVYEALLAHPEGLTDLELRLHLGLPERKQGSVAKRRHDCHARDTGLRRPSADGNPMVVWTLS